MNPGKKKAVNLLPPAEQKKNELWKLNTVLLTFGWLVSLSIVVLVILILGVRIFLASQAAQGALKTGEKAAILEGLRAGQATRDARTFEENLKNFQKLIAAGRPFGPPVLELARILPPDVTVDWLEMTRDGRIEIAGRAGTRESILTFRENIMASPLFRDINFPLKNLEKPRDASFRYSFYVK